FFIILFAAIYIISCAIAPTFEEKAISIGLTIIEGEKDEKGAAMQELLSKCSPVGKIEALSAKQKGDYIINKAVQQGANTVHIYYTDYLKEEFNTEDNSPQLHYIARFWKCKDPIKNPKKRKNHDAGIITQGL
ncbi:MAG: hypothetical protein FWG49_03690, partial [Leptospirales bacterium]|nr:hypothetical protein [Leptospirales bacterium]